VLFMFIGGFILLANVRAGGPVQSGQVA